MTGSPKFSIKSDGKELVPEFGVVSLRTNSLLNHIDTASIVLETAPRGQTDPEPSFADQLAPGKELIISVGYGDDLSQIYQGDICGLKLRAGKAKFLFQVDCRSKAWQLTRQPRIKSYLKQKDSDLFSTLAGTYSVDIDAEATTEQHPQIVQQQITDWDLLLTRAQINSLLVSTKDSKIKVFKPKFSASEKATIALNSGRDDDLQLIEFDCDIDGRDQIESVKVNRWDYEQDDVVTAQGSKPSTPAVQRGDKLSKSEPAKREFSYSQLISADYAKSIGDAIWLQTQLAQYQGTFIIDGSSKLDCGDVVKIDGLGQQFDGSCFVSGVSQQLKHGIWQTIIKTGLDKDWLMDKVLKQTSLDAASGQQLSSLHIGMVVKNTEDPDEINQIQVKLPLVYGPDHEGQWCRVALLDAGKDHSSSFYPDVGDEVIVGMVADDPNTAVILGKLHSKQRPGPFKIDKDNQLRGFYFNSKMEVTFNDKTKTMRLVTPAGNVMELSEDSDADDKEHISLTDQFGNKTLMNNKGVKVSTNSGHIVNLDDDKKNITHTSAAGHVLTLDDDNKKMAATSNGGNSWLLDDDGKKIEIKDANGNSIVLDDSGITINSSKDCNLKSSQAMNIEAGAAGTLKAAQDQQIKGMNVKLEASAQFSAQGSAGSKVASSAITEIQGSLVKIN